VARAGMTAHNSYGGQRQRRDKAGSLSSSGLRHEVQDSLSELERLIEQQHCQVCSSHTDCFSYIIQHCWCAEILLQAVLHAFLANVVMTAEYFAASLTLWRNSSHVLHARTGVPNSMVKGIVCILEDLAGSTHTSSCSKGHFSIAKSLVSTPVKACCTIQEFAVVVLLAIGYECANGIMGMLSELSVRVATHQRIVSGSFIPALTQHMSPPPYKVDVRCIQT